MILLAQLIEGKCSEAIHPHAFLNYLLSNGLTLPNDLDPFLTFYWAVC
jgi:hypothetical protein